MAQLTRYPDSETQLRRDPFARQTLMRHNVPDFTRKPCEWCGSRPGRFYYYWDRDDRSFRSATRDLQPHMFCSVECWEAYS